MCLPRCIIVISSILVSDSLQMQASEMYRGLYEIAGVSVSSPYELFLRGKSKKRTRPVWESMSGEYQFPAIHRNVKKLGDGLTKLKLHGPFSAGDGREWRMIGILSEISYESSLVELAASRQNITLVQIPDMAEKAIVDKVIRTTGIKTVVVSQRNLETLTSVILEQSNSVENIVVIGSKEKTRSVSNCKIWRLDENIAEGNSQRKNVAIGHKSDVNSIVFTGAALRGTLEGAVLTNGNILSSIEGLINSDLGLSKTDIYSVALPPSGRWPFVNLFERQIVLALLLLGARTVFNTGAEWLSRATVIAGDNRFYNSLKEKLTYPPRNLRLIISLNGQLPFTPSSAVKVVQGYGMVESAGLFYLDKSPMRNVDITLFDPSNIYESLGRSAGQICIAGPNVIKSYFGNPSLYSKSFDDGRGCLRTGYVGNVGVTQGEQKGFPRFEFFRGVSRLNSKNQLVITDSIENTFRKIKGVENAFVQVVEDQVIALVQIRPDLAARYADKYKVKVVNDLFINGDEFGATRRIRKRYQSFSDDVPHIVLTLHPLERFVTRSSLKWYFELIYSRMHQPSGSVIQPRVF